MDRLRDMALRVAAEKPLSPREESDLRKALVFVMDWEMDGGVVPPDIEPMTEDGYRPTPSEARRVVSWAKGLAPGSFWD